VDVRADLTPMRRRVEGVFAFLDDVIGDLPVPGIHKGLLQAHVREVGEGAMAAPRMTAVQVPLLVHAAVTGDEEPAIPVAAACTALHLGGQLQDGVLDEELSSFWQERGGGIASLAATTLMGSIPQRSIEHLRLRGTPPETLWALARQFADALLAAMSGQHEDLLFPDLADVTLEDCRAMMKRKSGAPTALLASSGATLATGDPSRIEAFKAFGLCYGVAKQLVNDVHDIWGEAVSQDLLNGKRTFPIVHALTVLDGERREELRGLLSLARASEGRHDEVRDMLAAAGSVRYTASIVWLHRERAGRHLAAASPGERAGRELGSLLDSLSILPKTEGALR
jgi:geranylgeranyl diphosphate synthase, type I